MQLNLKSRTIRDLARELADLTDDTMTGAVEVALREAIERRRPAVDAKRERIDRIAAHCAALPVRDRRTPEEILGYDADGLPRS
jgi:antitoxin VapB